MGGPGEIDWQRNLVTLYLRVVPRGVLLANTQEQGIKL